MVEIRVSEKIDISIEKAFQVLEHYKNYQSWWAIPVKTKTNIDKYVEFNPVPFVVIGLKQTHIIKNQLIEFEYIKGPFRGFGRWKLVQHKNGYVDISYIIQLRPINKLFEHVSKTKLFIDKHKRDIRNIIAQLKIQAGNNSTKNM